MYQVDCTRCKLFYNRVCRFFNPSGQMFEEQPLEAVFGNQHSEQDSLFLSENLVLT